MEVWHLRRPSLAATNEFLAHVLCGCHSHPKVASTEILAESKVLRRRCDFCPFRACLLAACFLLACLLAACCLVAKTVRSILDTEEGYETKTGSTSSVNRPYLGLRGSKRSIVFSAF